MRVAYAVKAQGVRGATARLAALIDIDSVWLRAEAEAVSTRIRDAGGGTSDARIALLVGDLGMPVAERRTEVKGLVAGEVV